MKYVKRNNKNNKLMMMALVVACIVIGIQMMVIFRLLDREETLPEGKQSQVDKAQTVINNDSNERKNILLNVVETPVMDLMYNTVQVDQLFARVESDDPCNVVFFAVSENQLEIELFRIIFGGSTGTKVGVIEDANGRLTDVCIDNGEYENADLTAAEKSIFDSIRIDLIDSILSNMNFTEIAEMANSAEYTEVMVETPFADIAYRTNYQDNLEIQINDGEAYEVAFYCAMPQKEAIKLFTYAFGREDGTIVGYLNDTPISLVIHEPALDETWSEEEIEIYYTMQEEVGHVIDELVKISGFKLDKTNDS